MTLKQAISAAVDHYRESLDWSYQIAIYCRDGGYSWRAYTGVTPYYRDSHTGEENHAVLSISPEDVLFDSPPISRRQVIADLMARAAEMECA